MTMDHYDDWRESAITQFEASYLKPTICDYFYPADEVGQLFKAYCLNCGHHTDEHKNEGDK